MKSDIHNCQGQIERKLQELSNSNLISESNKKVMVRFYGAIVSEGLQVTTIHNYLGHLFDLAKFFEKDFEKAGKEDIVQVVQKIETSKWAPATKATYKLTLKKFYKWLRNSEEGYPAEVRWIKIRQRSFRKLPEEILTEDDIKKMVEAAEGVRNKAFVFGLYDSGCRIGEFATLRLKNVSSDKHSAIIIVDGKTGSRRIRLFESSPFIQTWIENHPCKDDPNAPLWVGQGTRNKYKRLAYASCVSIVKMVAKKAGIKKRVYLHAFRHARATFLAKNLPESQLRQIMGWAPDSDMVAIYVHASGRDTDEALLKIYGVKTEEQKEPALTQKVCSRCSHVNSSLSKFCSKCAMALNERTIIDVDEKRRECDEVMRTLMQDNEFKALMTRKISELGMVERIQKL